MIESAIVNCTVLNIQPVNRGRILAVAEVELDVEGVVFVISGVEVFRFREPDGQRDMAGVGSPRYRAADGKWQEAIQLPPEVEPVLRDAVMRCAIELGIARCHETLMSARPDSGVRQGWHQR